MDWADIYERLREQPDDHAAWGALQRYVRGWAHRALYWHGREVVEDTVAETCAGVALTLDRARGAATFRGFVLGVFLNVRRRALHDLRAPIQDLDGIDVAAPVADSGPDPDEVAALQAALAELPPRELHAVRLRYFDERSALEIGAALGVTEGNARRIVCNGLGRLRRQLTTDSGCRRLARAQGGVGRARVAVVGERGAM
jgi:RNA polymerase sigma factor (sigma-70 family)